MWFLIGVLIFIGFILIFYLFIKFKIRTMLNNFGFEGMDLDEIIKEAKLEDEEIPKSLANMEKVYLGQIRKDFPDLNINQLKRKSEKVIIDCYNGIEDKDSSKLKGKCKSFVEDLIRDYDDKEIHFNEIKFHNTVVSNYKKDNGVCTITFSSSFQYYLILDDKSKKVQDRVKTEFIYIIDENKVPVSKKVLGIHCPNCGSPIKNLGEKKCSYCGGAVRELFGKVFTCNDIVRY